MPETLKMLFHHGRVVMTHGADEVLKRSGQAPMEFVRRHCSGDWGTLDDSDRRLNDKAAKTGTRLLSAYEAACGETIWVISDHVEDHPERRALTTLLLPEEY